jgi:hypothetical protein
MPAILPVVRNPAPKTDRLQTSPLGLAQNRKQGGKATGFQNTQRTYTYLFLRDNVYGFA